MTVHPEQIAADTPRCLHLPARCDPPAVQDLRADLVAAAGHLRTGQVLVVDAAAVTECPPALLGVLVAAEAIARRRGATVRLEPATGTVAEEADRCGLGRRLLDRPEGQDTRGRSSPPAQWPIDFLRSASERGDAQRPGEREQH
ncbi:hypothetical protein BH24ACT13_BH24ACT13_06630 [soil metagenome]|jgi:anti-anti-sigma regulatory factor